MGGAQLKSGPALRMARKSGTAIAGPARTSYAALKIAGGSRYTPFVMTSCAFKIHRASRPGQGKPVLISILACSLAFHPITLERNIFTKIVILK